MTANPLTTIRFGEVPFAEAIEALRRYVPMSADQWNALSLNARRQAISFADAASEGAAAAVQRVLEQALVDPVRGNFQERANAVLERYDVTLSPHQADTIYDTVMNRAINDGKLEQIKDPVLSSEWPYMGLDTAADSRVRPNHYAMDWRRIKTVFPVNDPGLANFAPPLGYRCRCTWRFFSREDVEKFGLTVGQLSDFVGKSTVVSMPDGREVPTIVIPDNGFGGGTLTAKDVEEHVLCGCGRHPVVHPLNLGLIILALHCAQRKAA
ncbi:MAG: phage minor head protein [Verrucomicrobiia bacterium]